MVFNTTSPASEIQAEIDRQSELCRHINPRGRTAAITKLWHSATRFSIAFLFPQSATIGQVFNNFDGSRHEVVAIL